MINVQTGNMLDVIVEGKSLGLKPRGSDNVLWLPEPEGLRDVLAAEIRRVKSLPAPKSEADIREEARQAERRRLLLVIQSLPPTSAGAGAFKASIIAALEAAEKGEGDG